MLPFRARPNPAVAIALALPLAAAAAEPRAGFQPRLKALSVSAGLYLDRWGGTGSEGNGPGWKGKSVLYNPPQTLAGLNLGAGFSLLPKVGLNVSAPFFRNSIDPYTSSRSGVAVPGQSAAGMGDVEIALPVRVGAFSLQPSFAAPWAYQAEFLKPWRGLGVYRTGLALSWGAKGHSLWTAGDVVAYKPEGGKPGLVEPLDFVLKGGYGHKRRLSARFSGRAGADLSFTSFSWAGDDPQRNYSADPRLSLSFAPAPGHDLSASASATLYSYQGGSRTYHTYASRRIGLGLYYGRYF